MCVLSTGFIVRPGPLPTSPSPLLVLTQIKLGCGFESAEHFRVTESTPSLRGTVEDDTTVTLGGS